MHDNRPNLVKDPFWDDNKFPKEKTDDLDVTVPSGEMVTDADTKPATPVMNGRYAKNILLKRISSGKSGSTWSARSSINSNGRSDYLGHLSDLRASARHINARNVNLAFEKLEEHDEAKMV